MMRLLLATCFAFATLTFRQPLQANLFNTFGGIIAGTEGLELAPGADLSNLHLASLDAGPGTNLRDATFANSKLRGAVFRDGDFSGVNFEAANLENASLRGDFTGANFTDVDLSHSTIYGRSQLFSGVGSDQVYSTASYQNRDLRGVRFAATPLFFFLVDPFPLTGWDFSWQDMSGAILSRADATGGVNFSNARLHDADLTTIRLDADTNFRGATLSSAELMLASAAEVDLSGTQTLENSDFRRANLQSANLAGTLSYGTSFFGADLGHAVLHNADLLNADLRSAVLKNSEFQGANLQNANLEFADGLALSSFDDATQFNQWTVFPAGLNVESAGLRILQSPAGDFDANANVNHEDIKLLRQRLARGTDPIDDVEIRDDVAFYVNPNKTVVDTIRDPYGGVQGNVFVTQREDVDIDDIRTIFDLTNDFEFTLLIDPDLNVHLAERRKLKGENDEWLEPMFDVSGDGSVNRVDEVFLIESILDTKRGDANLDGRIDSADLNLVALNWQSRTNSWAKGDFDGNGRVNSDDLNLLGSNWQFGIAKAVPLSVPEPVFNIAWIVTACLLRQRRFRALCVVSLDVHRAGRVTGGESSTNVIEVCSKGPCVFDLALRKWMLATASPRRISLPCMFSTPSDSTFSIPELPASSASMKSS